MNCALVAIRALLRPSLGGRDARELVTHGPVRIDLKRRIVTKHGEEVHLSKREWDLLDFLARRPDHVLTHKLILKEVRGLCRRDRNIRLEASSWAG